MARQIAAGAYLPLDKAKLPNLHNLDPHMLALAATADPGNRYGVPYLWSVTGLGYNIAMLDRALGPEHAPRDSLALVFDPEIAAKLDRSGIEIIDTPQEVVPAALTISASTTGAAIPPIWTARRRCSNGCGRISGGFIRRNTSTIWLPATSASRSAIRAT